jgi:DivIVA domain-containing protein
MTSNETASAPLFPLERGRTKGYERRAVDAFLIRARSAFETGDQGVGVSAATIRSVSFPMVRHGYSVVAVDTALARIENAFAARQRDQAIANSGTAAWLDSTRNDAQVILDRLSRPKKERFDRVGFGRWGYRVDEVDVVADKIAAYFTTGAPVSADQVRSVAFRMQRGGYSEVQVDAVLDAVVEVMLAVA